MAVPNIYLINLVVHDTILPRCFCNGCRERRFNASRDINREELQNMFTRTLPSKERSQLNKLFDNTINEIVVGKVFKVSSLEHTGYKYFKSWARHEPDLIALSPKQFSKFCEKVIEASRVFDYWDVIVLK